MLRCWWDCCCFEEGWLSCDVFHRGNSRIYTKMLLPFAKGEEKKCGELFCVDGRLPFLLHLHRSHFSPLKCHVTDETRVSVDSPKNWPTGTRPRTWVWLDICDATSKAAVRGAVVVPDRDTSNRGLGIVSLFLENTILLQLSTQSCNPDWFNTRLCSVTFVCMRKLNYV